LIQVVAQLGTFQCLVADLVTFFPSIPHISSELDEMGMLFLYHK
jgi:hypothetical protein